MLLSGHFLEVILNHWFNNVYYRATSMKSHFFWATFWPLGEFWMLKEPLALIYVILIIALDYSRSDSSKSLISSVLKLGLWVPSPVIWDAGFWVACTVKQKRGRQLPTVMLFLQMFPLRQISRVLLWHSKNTPIRWEWLGFFFAFHCLFDLNSQSIKYCGKLSGSLDETCPCLLMCATLF